MHRHRGAAFAADFLSQVETGEDALANVSSQLSRKINTDITTMVSSVHWPLWYCTCSQRPERCSGSVPDDSNYCTTHHYCGQVQAG